MARAHVAQHAWAALRISERCDVLARLRHQIARQCDSIAATIARETNKPLLDALAGDVLVSLEQMRYYEKRAARILRPRRIGKPAFLFSGARFESHFEPHGVALICSPANYPFQLSIIPLITALAAGNAVILKCSERTPETAERIARLCTQAGLPPALVQVLHDEPEQAEALIEAGPDMIFFTGSSRHGRQVAQRAANYLIPAILELGGKDASLIFADCHLQRAVEGIAYGAFSNAGRVCVAVKRAYIEESIYDAFVHRLTQRIAQLHVRNDPETDLCPLSGSALSFHLTLVRDALSRGAKLRFPQQDALSAGGPVILADVPAEARILTEESFGPALCVAPFRSENEAVALANAGEFALSSSVWTRNRARAKRITAQICAGSCAVNDVIRTIANPNAAFGGNRHSGYGRYHGPEGLRSFSRLKTVMRARDSRASQINWFPFTSRTREQLAKLIRLRHSGAAAFAPVSRFLVCILAMVLLPLRPAAQTAKEDHLSIDVHLTAQAHGELAYLIFASPSGFPGEVGKALRHGFLPIVPGVSQMQIHVELPPGTYAVSVYEDLNSNRKLDRNFIGIPREPVGVSNNPRPHFGPPRFSECSFHLEKSTTITIDVVKGI